MFTLFCIAMFVVFCIVEASGADWVQGQRNADRRTRAIIGAIKDSSSSITDTQRNIWEEQIDYYERFSEDLQNEREFKDEHGRWFRERMVYDNEGRVIAKEVIGIEK